VVPSVLRGFSAPVKITTQPTDDEMIFRMAHDSDGFNKYEATERLMVKTLHKLIKQAESDVPLTIDRHFIEAYGENVKNAMNGDLAFNARTLGLPPYNIIIQDLKVLDPDAVSEAIDFLKATLAKEFESDFKAIYTATAAPAGETYNVIPAQVGRRELHNTALGFIGKLETPEAAHDAVAQYGHSKNMTEKLSALAVMTKMTPEAAVQVADKLLEDFYTRYKDNNNLVDKWLSLQAGRPAEGALERVRELMKHEAYDATNPNKVYALIGGFTAGNPSAFHAKDGSGYKFLADTVIELNDVNAKTATNLAKRFTQFKRYDAERQALMVEQMERIMAVPTLDVGIKEIIGKALDTVEKAPVNDNARKATPARKQG